MFGPQIIVKATRVLRLIHLPRQELSQYTVRLNQHCLLRKRRSMFNTQLRSLRKEAKDRSQWKAKHDQDGLAKDFEFIYGSTNTNYVIYGASVIAVMFSGLLILCGNTVFQYHVYGTQLKKGSSGHYHSRQDTGIFMVYTIILFIISSSVFVFKGCRSCILRMYYHPKKDSYVGILFRPFMKNKLEFKMRDVQFLGKEKEKIFNFEIHGKRYMINEPGFIDGKHYKKLTGLELSQPNDHLPISLVDNVKLSHKERKARKQSVGTRNVYSDKKREMKNKMESKKL